MALPAPPAAAMTLYRAAQEGLTNAQKHAKAQHATVALHFMPDHVSLNVWNDGPLIHTNGKAKGGGFGLVGLQARAEQLRGTFQAGPLAQGGFQLELSLPIRARIGRK